MVTRSSIKQPLAAGMQLPQPQVRNQYAKQYDSQVGGHNNNHLEFDERLAKDGKVTQLGRLNIYQNGVRNVLTAGEHNKRFVDHFPVSRASRWRGNGGDTADMMSTDLNPVTSMYGNSDEVRA